MFTICKLNIEYQTFHCLVHFSILKGWKSSQVHSNSNPGFRLMGLSNSCVLCNPRAKSLQQNRSTKFAEKMFLDKVYTFRKKVYIFRKSKYLSDKVTIFSEKYTG